MATEHETRVLDIDKDEMARLFSSLGASGSPEVLQRRWVFDISEDRHDWIRLRDDGEHVTLTYKRKTGDGISGTEEIEVAVSDFAKTAEILKRLPFSKILYQENRRMRFLLDGAECTIDSWPGIPPFLEIEAESEARVRAVLARIGFEGKDDGNRSIRDIYTTYGIDLHAIGELGFDRPIPAGAMIRPQRF